MFRKLEGNPNASEVQQFIDHFTQLCTDLKPAIYTRIVLGATTLEQEQTTIGEATARKILEDSGGRFALTQLETKEYVNWFLDLCSINEAEALTYEIPIITEITVDMLTSFPLQVHQYVTAQPDLETEVWYWLTHCEPIRNFIGTAFNVDYTIEQIKVDFIDRIYTESKQMGQDPAITKPQAQDLWNWVVTSCGVK